jgi:hypothetical protein
MSRDPQKMIGVLTWTPEPFLGSEIFAALVEEALVLSK